LGTIAAGTTGNVTTGGATGSSAISDLKIEQANFGTASSIAVSVQIDRQATQAALTYSGGALSADLILELGGKSGFETFNFGNGTTISQIASAINTVSDATGVQAVVSGTNLTLKSSEYGSDAFVSAKALSGNFSTIDDTGATSTRDNGTDVSARINGVQATGEGLKASLNTSTLDLNFVVNSNFQDGDDFSFNITGGGATFQIGPDVVSNQQARIGIQGVSTATLGGVSGKLFEVRLGGAKDLATDVKGAARVIDEVISTVTGLRGRLGAFQRTTLESNIITLGATLENLTAAESSIRDADFATESAALTRAQILVQSGTSVLQIALLRG
jgi:flagellin